MATFTNKTLMITGGTLIALRQVLVIVQISIIGNDAVEHATIDRMGTFFIGQESFVELLSMTNTDDLRRIIRHTKELFNSLSQHIDRAGIRLLYKQVSLRTILKGIQYQIDSFVQIHDEAGHATFGDGQWQTTLNLVNEQRNNRATAAHHVSVTGAADAGLVRINIAGLRDDDFLHHGLANTHSVDWISRLISRQADHSLNSRLDRSSQHILRAQNIRLDSLNGEKLA